MENVEILLDRLLIYAAWFAGFVQAVWALAMIYFCTRSGGKKTDG